MKLSAPMTEDELDDGFYEIASQLSSANESIRPIWSFFIDQVDEAASGEEVDVIIADFECRLREAMTEREQQADWLIDMIMPKLRQRFHEIHKSHHEPAA